MTTAPETRLRALRRHREALALALRLGCSLGQARALIVDERLCQRRAAPVPSPPPQPALGDQPPAFWWQRY